jgi:hypothetical protein
MNALPQELVDHALTLGPTGSVSWDILYRLADTLDIALAPTATYRDLLLLAVYILRACRDIAHEDETPQRTTTPEEERFTAAGLSVGSARRISCVRNLMLAAALVSGFIRRSSEWHSRARTSPDLGAMDEMATILPDTRAVRFLGDVATPVTHKFEMLSGLAHVAYDHAHLCGLRFSATAATTYRDGVLPAHLLHVCCGSLVALVESAPHLLFMLGARVESSLRSLVQVVRTRYEADFANSVRDEFARAARRRGDMSDNDERLQRVVTIDPETAISVAAIELALVALEALRNHPKRHEPLFEYAAAYRKLLSDHRPSPVRFGMDHGYTALSPFVVPPIGRDEWPASIPEAESVVRTWLVEKLLTDRSFSKSTKTTIIVSPDKSALVLVAPNFSVAPDCSPFVMMKLRPVWDSDPLTTWLSMPSTSGPGPVPGAFTGSLYGSIDKTLTDAHATDLLVTRLRTIERTAAEIGLAGAGGVGGSPLIAALFPSASPELLHAAGAIAGYIAAKWLEWYAPK